MTKTAREEILNKLKAAEKKAVAPRPEMPGLNELSLTGEELIARFTREAMEQTAVVHRVQDNRGVLDRLTDIVQAAGITGIMVSNDDVVSALDLPAWGRKNRVNVYYPDDFRDRSSFKNAVFNDVQAGVTGVDFAVAESGTIGLIHSRKQPRLISLAPIMHIAVVPLNRLVAVYENITDALFGEEASFPRHFTLITGPSMTGDIQATLFKGMHGPRKVEVILVG